LSGIAVITIDVDPNIHLGPLDLAWHGLTTAVGILVAASVAIRYAHARGLDPDPLFSAALWIVVAGVLGARALFLVENDAGALLEPAEWIGSQGFSVYGGMIAGGAAAALLLHGRQLGLGYLDAIAAGFPFGMAVGRIGDLINGEHYGGPSDLPWAIRYTHPAAEVPSAQIAYHPGGLYEIVLALLIAAAVAGLYRRLRRPGQLLFLVVGLYAIGRFVMFFYRADSDPLVLGFDTSQCISLAIALASAIGFWSVTRGRDGDRLEAQGAPPPAGAEHGSGRVVSSD
jgi:phosphatidylglycerol---prolipoprotein diacylglyceryl transferase